MPTAFPHLLLTCRARSLVAQNIACPMLQGDLLRPISLRMLYTMVCRGVRQVPPVVELSRLVRRQSVTGAKAIYTTLTHFGQAAPSQTTDGQTRDESDSSPGPAVRAQSQSEVRHRHGLLHLATFRSRITAWKKKREKS